MSFLNNFLIRIFGVVPVICISATLHGSTNHPVREGILFPKGQQVNAIVAINMSALNPAQQVMISTLQGVVAKNSATQIFMDAGGPPWKSFLNQHYKIPVTNQPDPWAVLAKFATNVDGYILYNRSAKIDSLNAATSLCGPYKAIAVDVSIEGDVKRAGVSKKILDVSDRDEQWVYDNYRKLLNPLLGAEINESITYHLRDYAVMANAFVFYDKGPLHERILKEWPPHGGLMGYADVSVKKEYGAYVEYAKRGIFHLGADMAANLSLLSSIYDGDQRQQNHPPEPTTESKVHYVTFLMSDGDNVAFDLWSLHGQFSRRSRGQFSMGWPILPSMVDYSPSVLRWYYENASTVNGKRDNFIAQGGVVGTYFSAWPAERLTTHIRKVNAFMKAADTRLLSVIDRGAFDRVDLWDKFTAQPNIEGIFYQNYGGPCSGRVIFSNGKPIVDLRAALWKGIAEEKTIAARINSSPRNPHVSEGYSAILVHCWSKNLDDVYATIKLFKPDVRVLTPEEFMGLIRKNVVQK